MPLGIACLLNNTPAINYVESALKVLVSERISNGNNATFPEIYNEIRRQGVEIDAQTLGTIYNGVYGGYNVNELSTIDEVESFAGRDFENQLKSLTDAALGENDDIPKEQKSGKLSSENAVVNTISKIFQRENFKGTENVKSALRSMEDLVTKAANSLLKKEEKKGQTLTQALSSFFDIESNKFTQVDGTLNTLETLTEKVKIEVKNYVDQIANKLDDAEADIFRQKWEAYTNAFVNSLYDITLNKSNQSKLINESLKQVKIDGVGIVDVNGNVKWTALIEFKNPETIEQKVSDLFYKGFKDKEGNIVKYSREQSDRIGEYFLREYKTRLADATARATANNRSKNLSAKNIISDFLKDRGFFDLVKDKNGKLLLTKVDWNTLLDKVKAQIGSRKQDEKSGETAIDLMKVALNKYLSDLTVKDENGNDKPKFNNEQKLIIEKEFIDTITAKLQPSTAEANDIERLIALSELNGGNAFNSQTQSALNKVVGVSDLEQETLNKILSLSVLAGNIINGNNVPTGTASSNPSVNRGAYAFQALSEIDRKIKELLRSAKIDANLTQRYVKYTTDLIGAATTSLLINPANAAENVVTGFGSNITESVNMLFRNPQLFFKTVGSNQKDFWITWANYATGGAYNETTNEADLSNDIQSSERLRARAAINQVKDKGFVGFWGVVSQIPQLAVSMFSRVGMNSFDAAFNSAILRKKALQSIYYGIKEQGILSNGNTAIKQMDKAFNIDAATNKELDKEVERISSLMKDAGMPVTSIFKIQLRRDLKFSLYEDVMQDVAVDKSATIRQATEATKALIAASQAQSKTLTGKRQLKSKDWVTVRIYGLANGILAPQKSVFEMSRKSEQEGKLTKAGFQQLGAGFMQNTYGKFIGGVANFLVLGISSTPYGFIQAYSLKKQGNNLSNDGADVFKGDPEDVKRHAEMMGMARSIAMRSIVGSTAIAMFILKNWVYDDDEENKDDGLANLMQTKSGRRLMQKFYPMAISLMAAYTYKSENGKKKPLDRFLEMTSSYTGKDFDSYTNFLTGLRYAKTDADIKEVWAKTIGGFAPTFNINQAEQITKFKDAAQSFFDKDEIRDVQRNEGISKNMYKSLEGVMDGFLVNGSIDALTRLFSNKPFNRFDKK